MFPTTRWSALIGVRSDVPAERERSFTALLAAYWKPAYKHVRLRWKQPRADAEDLIQAFFERAMEKDVFASYEPERSRFRTFLRVCLDRFAANEEKARTREKRGGGAQHLSFDFEGAEDELARSAVASASASADEVFDREWRRSLFSLAVDALRAHCETSSKQSAFTLFERYDLADAEARPTYDQLARELQLPATTVTNQLAWARKELRRLVLEKLEEITATHEEFRDEAKLLLGIDVK